MRCRFSIACACSRSATSCASTAARRARSAARSAGCATVPRGIAAKSASPAAAATTAQAVRRTEFRSKRVSLMIVRSRPLSAGERIRKMEGRQIGRRPGLVLDGRRRIGGKPIGDVLRAVRILAAPPAALARADEALEPVKLSDLPDAVLLDVLVLVRPFAPARVLAVAPGHDQPAAASLRGLAVRRDRDDRHQLHVLVELAFGEPGAAVTERVEV